MATEYLWPAVFRGAEDVRQKPALLANPAGPTGGRVKLCLALVHRRIERRYRSRYDTELPAESSVELDSQRRRPSGLTFLDPNALVLDVHAPEIGRRLWLCVGEARRSSGR